MSSKAPRRRRWIRWLTWIIGVVVSITVLIAVGTSIYVHVSTAPAALTLPTDVGPGSAASSGPVSADGVWRAGPGSVVGWRIEQVLIGQQSPIVGRTDKVWGSITVSGGSVTQGSFSVDMASLTSSTSKTTQRTVFDVSTYPTATVVLTGPITLGAIPAAGVVERFPAAANITMHGLTHPVHFTFSVERFAADVYVLADITFPYGIWSISAQGVPFLADLQSPATIEVLLHLTHGNGNPSSVAASVPSSPGGSI